MHPFCFGRYDYENVDSDGANKMVALLRQAVEDSSLVGKTYQGGVGENQKSYQIKTMDDFAYTDPIDGSVSQKQVSDTWCRKFHFKSALI